MHSVLRCALVGVVGLACPFTVAAQSAAPASGPSFELRLRGEAVDDDGFARNAQAITLRARFGYRFQFNSIVAALIEAEHTGHLGPSDYNSTANGQTTFPTVVDPDNTELNQALLAFTPSSSVKLNLGRQRLNFGNQRFVGSVGWRQNDQTFDAVETQLSFEGTPTLRYAYLDRVQRIFGAEHPNRNLARWDLDAHVLELNTPLGPGTLTGYAHYFDIRTLPQTSHRNLGLRYALQGGPADGLGWSATAEFAQQRPHADGADRNEAEYGLLEGGLRWKGHQFSAGIEQLGGDGRYGFQTPFATGHAFNGWADRFLTTPADGLRDTYVGWKHSRGAWQAAAVYHRFDADHGSADYGDEIDLQLGWAFRPKWNALFKYARYSADDFARDVDKLWLSLEYRL